MVRIRSTLFHPVLAVATQVSVALLLGVWMAFVLLNAAAGCGQGGACLSPADFTAPPLIADNS